MITGWLVKVVVGIALVGFLAFELGSPLITRAQLDDLAHDAADTASLELLNTGNVDGAKAEATRILTDKNATLREFTMDPEGRVDLTAEREARSLLLKKWDRTKSWYLIRVKVKSEKKAL